MANRVMILGGYGNFGKRICLALVKANIDCIIVGRDITKATACKAAIEDIVPTAVLAIEIADIRTQLSEILKAHQPTIVIDTCGPFQGASYAVIETCIAHQAHYIDLADARDFVTGITQLDEKAKQQGVAVISGASSVPGLSSAVVAHFQDRFKKIKILKYGISTAQKTADGLATASAILSYLGKPLKPFKGCTKRIYGWQNLYWQDYPLLGKRWMASCDVPDLDLLPPYFNLDSIQFSAGVESRGMHFFMWLTSWAIRLGLPIDLSRHAKAIQFLCKPFNWGCKNQSGMHVILKGIDDSGENKTIKWFIIAEYGEGLEIPTIAAIVLAKKIIKGEFKQTGAMPCVALVSLTEYLEELQDFHIKVYSPDDTCD